MSADYDQAKISNVWQVAAIAIEGRSALSTLKNEIDKLYYYITPHLIADAKIFMS